KGVRSDRLRCGDTGATGEGQRALKVTIKPGDAYEADPASAGTERVEVQVLRELIRIDTTTWYSFLVRVHGPWLDSDNRTGIQQIKQNIDARYEVGRGGKEVCAPANPLFKIEVGSDGTTPLFRAKATGTAECGDDVGKKLICGDWPMTPDTWHRVHV